MKILGQSFKVDDTFSKFMTVPDCWVTGGNKIGGGHGESKFYIGSKNEMHSFYGNEGFTAPCFILKSDLISFMNAVKHEYEQPNQDYKKKNEFQNLWYTRMELIDGLDDKIEFLINDQLQIEGDRGYVNSKDSGYLLLRDLALPLISYISSMRLIDKNGKKVFYWKLFPDFQAIEEKATEALVFTYGKKKSNNLLEGKKDDSKRVSSLRKEINNSRIGQGKYREGLLELCPTCPITGISDERLLIASHIKPWAASSDEEKVDPYNGYMLSPLYDKLFDRGFITFTEDRHIIVSDWISPINQKRMGLVNNKFIQQLPMDAKRIEYLSFHHSNVFHGLI